MDQFSSGFEKPKLKKSQWPIRTKIRIIICQWELKVQARKTPPFLFLHLIGLNDGEKYLDQTEQRFSLSLANENSKC